MPLRELGSRVTWRISVCALLLTLFSLYSVAFASPASTAVTTDLAVEKQRSLGAICRALLSDVGKLFLWSRPSRDISALRETSRRIDPPTQQEPRFRAEFGPRIMKVRPATGEMDIEFTLYLPSNFGDHVEIRGDFSNGEWLPMERTDVTTSKWSRLSSSVRPGMRYEFRYKNGSDVWQIVTDPMAYSYTKELNPDENKVIRGFHYTLSPLEGTQVQIRGTFTGDQWVSMKPSENGDDTWRLGVKALPLSESSVLFRYRNSHGEWKEVDGDDSKYREIEVRGAFDHYAVVPDMAYDWKHRLPIPRNGVVVFEGTLPGLLANWKDGEYFPNDSKDLDGMSLAERIRQSGVIDAIKEKGYNAIMLPIQASAADLVSYNWKFSYLIRGFGAIDSHIGTWSEMKALIDEFHRAGILVIPDLVFVHHVKNTSIRSIDTMVDASGRHLWFDDHPKLHRDYGTWMVNLEDPVIRKQLVEQVVRLVSELRLPLFRFDYVDGMLIQYENRPVNYGEIFVRELVESFKRNNCPAVRVSEAFEKGQTEAAKLLADVRYHPWVGFVAADQALMVPEAVAQQGIDIQPIVRAISNATGKQYTTPGLGYAFSHDEVGRDEDVMKGRQDPKTGVPSNAVGGHAGQLAQNRAKRLVELGLLERSEMLNYSANHVAMIEAIAMFGSDFAYMTGGFFKLGSYDEANGWQALWRVDQNPDIATWAGLTGLPKSRVQSRLERYEKQMELLRKVFQDTTPIDYKTRKPVVVISSNHSNPEKGIFTILRKNSLQPEKSLLVVVNFGREAFSSYEIPAPEGMPGKWEVVTDLNGTNPPYERVASKEGDVSSDLPAIGLKLSPHNMVVLRYVP